MPLICRANRRLRFRFSSLAIFPSARWRPVFAFLAALVSCLSLVAGQPPPLAFQGVQSKLNAGAIFTNPAEVAVDSAGDVFVLDSTTGLVSEIVAVNGVIPDGPTVLTLANSFVFQNSFGMAIDANGNLFLPGGSTLTAVGMYEIPASNRNANPTQLGGTFNAPYAVALDASGNIFVTEDGALNYDIKEISASSGYTTVTTPITGLAAPAGIAIDGSGNIFVADGSGSSIKEFTAASSYASQSTLPQSFGAILNMTIDAMGNLYVADSDYAALYEILAPGGYTAKITISTDFVFPTGVAVAANGNLFISDVVGAVDEIQRPGTNLGSLGLGGAGLTQSLLFDFAGTETSVSWSVLTLGATGLDFQEASGTTCAASANSSCFINVVFNPTAAGLRRGAVAVTYTASDSTVHNIAIPIYATADAPQMAFEPGTVSPVSTGGGTSLSGPFQSVVDGAGNMYTTDTSNNVVVKIPAGGGAATTLTLTPAPTALQGIAIDGAGDLYISDSAAGNIKVLNASGYSGVLPIVGLATPLSFPGLIAMDGEDQLYIADFFNNRIVKVAIASAGDDSVTGIGSVVATGSYSLVAYGGVFGVAADPEGNVYATQGQDSARIIEIAPSDAVSLLSFPPSIEDPVGMDLDAFSNLYVSDYQLLGSPGGNLIEEQTTGGVNVAILLPGFTLANPGPVSFDSAGKIYIPDNGNGRILKVDPATPYSPNFENTAVNAASADSPHTFTIINTGDRNLQFTSIAYPASFPVNAADTNLCSTSVPVLPGETCDISVDFVPASVGSLSGNVVLTDNNLFAESATQSIPIAGTGIVPDATATAVTVTPSTLNLNDGATLQATVTDTTSIGTTPTGTVTFTDTLLALTTTAASNVALVNGVASYSYTVSGIGSHTITATYTPSGAFTGSSGTAAMTVNKETPLILWATPAPIFQGTALSSTQLDATSKIPGTFVYTPAAGTIPAAGIVPLNVTLNPTNTADFTSATATVNLLVLPAPQSFGSVAVGATSSPITITFPFASAVTLGSSGVKVVTQGVAGLDFANAGTGTCAAGGTVSAATSCTVVVTFSPEFPGQRLGAVELLDGSGNLLATVYLSGTGTAGLASFPPGSQSAVADTTSAYNLYNPQGIAVDYAGNVYIADASHIYKETPTSGSYTQSTISSAYSHLGAVVVDGAGNLYVCDYEANAVYLEKLTGGTYTQSTIANSSAPYNLNSPYGLAVDSAGQVYVAAAGNNAVFKETFIDGVWVQSTVAASGLNQPSGVAVDASGAVYITDINNNRLLKETPSGAGYMESVVSNSGLSYPYAVVVDTNGNVYVGDGSDGNVFVETLSGGSYTQSLFLSGYNAVLGLAFDQTGNLYVGDNGGSTVYKVDLADPPSESFASTKVGATSSDSPKSVTVFNSGNAALTFPAPGSGTNPALSAGFAFNAASTCPQIPHSGLAGTLAANATCVYSIGFAPTATGSISGSLAIKDNSNNVAGSSQSAPLSGTGLAPDTTSLVVTAAPSAIVLGGSSSISATATDTSVSSGIVGGSRAHPENATPTTPTGTVTFTDTVGGTTTTIASNVALVSGLATVATPYAATPVGLHTITAAFTPFGPFAASTGTAALLVEPVPVAFPNSPVGTATSTITVTIPFASAVTLGNPAVQVVTQGAAALDFANAGTGTCTNGKALSAGGTCTVVVRFTPKYPGPRYGAILVVDGSGNVLATVYLTGVGTGPMVNFLPGTFVPVAAAGAPYNLQVPASSQVDSSGNLYVADHDANAVYKEAPSVSGYVQTTLPTTGLSLPEDVAVDGAGNIYIADSNNLRVVELASSGGSYTQSTILNLNYPGGIAVDAQGNLFVSTVNDGFLYKETLANGAYTQTTVASGLNQPRKVAVDVSGNVYVADSNNGQVLKETPNGSGYTQSVVLGSLNEPYGVAVDANGNVYIADRGDGSIYIEQPAGSGYTNFQTYPGGGGGEASITVDQKGNLYVSSVSQHFVAELDRFDPPIFDYPNTLVGQTDSIGAAPLTFLNQGNATLTLSVPGTGLNPTLTTGYALSGSTTCTRVPAGGAAIQFAPNANCNYGIEFTPVATGLDNGALVFTDNSLNKAGARQSVGLVGTGTAPDVTATALSISPATNSYESTTNLTATVTDTTSSGTTPTGTVNFTDTFNGVTTSIASAVNFTGNQATTTYYGAVVGSHTIKATYVPAGDFVASSSTVVLVVTKATPTIAWAEPAPIYYGTNLAGVLNALAGGVQQNVVPAARGGKPNGARPEGRPAGLSGTYAYTATPTSGSASPVTAATIPTAGTYQLGVTFTPTDAADYTTATATVTLVVLPPPTNFGNVPAGTRSAPITLSIPFAAAVTLGDPGVQVVTEGVAGLDFANAGTGTCMANLAIAAGSSCTVIVTFTPKYPGARQGAVLLMDASGNLLTSQYLAGTGTGATAIFPPGVQSTVATSPTQPFGVAVDIQGNLYLSSPTVGKVWKETLASGAYTESDLATGLNQPNGVAVDGAGNVYVAEYGSGRVLKFALLNGVYTQAAAVTGLSGPYGVAVDGAGNLYVADGSANSVYKETLVNGEYVQSVIRTGLSQPSGVAVDGIGNVYISDTNNYEVLKETLSDGSYSETVALSSSDVESPYGLAVDAAGNIYVADYSYSEIFKATLAGGVYTVSTVGLNVAYPECVAVDAAGNIYTADNNDLTIKLDLADPPVLSFATTSAGSTSSDSPQIVTFGNIGNELLTIGAPSTGSNPTISNGFAIRDSKGTTCPQLAAGSAVGTLPVNAQCGYAIDFTPTKAGLYSGSLALTDNNYNVSGTIQTVSLNGTGVAGAASNLALSGVPSQILAGGNLGSVQVHVTDTYGNLVADSSASVTVTVTGPAAFSQAVTGSAVNGVFSANLGGIALPAPGTYAVTATSSTLTSAIATVIANPVATTIAASPATSTYSRVAQSVTLSATVSSTSGAVNAGTVTFTLLNGTALVGSSVTSDTVASGTASASYTLPLGTGAGTYIIQAAFNAGGIFAASTDASHTLTIAKAGATVTLSALNQTYTGSPLTVTAATIPPSLAVTITYNGSPNLPSAAGSYAVTATIDDPNYSGTATGTLTIAQASQSISFSPLGSPITYTTPIPLTATGGGSGNPVVFSVLSGPGYVTGNLLTVTGSGTLVVAANQSGNANYQAAPQVTQTVVSLASTLKAGASSLAFGSVPVGTASPTQTVIVSNPNVFPVSSVSATATGDFTAASNCPTIAGLGTCSINVTFTPTSSGARSGTLSVSDAQSSGQLTAALSGTGSAAGIQFNAAALDFGSVVTGTTSFGQTVTIQNTGTANLVVSKVATSGDFATTGNCAMIPAGSNCSLAVTFTPTATGPRAGVLTLTDNDGGPDQNQTLNLSGLGTAAGVALMPSVAILPGTGIGSNSFIFNTTLTNTGTATLTGISISILGDFSQTNTCAASLAAGASCVIGVTYSPTVPGAETGTLTVADNLGAQTVALTGNGVVPGASLSTGRLLFGGQLLGTFSLAQTVVLSNTGSTAIGITSVTPSSGFTDTTNCSGSLASGANCSVNVFFAPTAAGAATGTLSLVDDAGTQVVALSGQGVSPGLAIAPSFVIFGAQTVGTSSQAETLTVTNTSSSSLTLNPLVISNGFAVASQCPAVLDAGLTCTVSLSFAPTSIGAVAGSLVVSDSTGSFSSLATVSGQGELPGVATLPASLFFGSLPLGIASQGQTVTVSNAGVIPLKIGAVSGTGDFAETDTCSNQTVAPGGYCVISVTMTPTTAGTRTGAIQFANSADGLHTIALSGVGQQAGVSITPTSLAFGSAPIASPTQRATGTSLSVVIGNTSGNMLTLGNFATQGDFSASSNCSSTLAPGDTCTLTVTFLPTALAHRTGTLTVTDDAGGGSQTVSLAGDGSPAGLILTPPVLDFGVQSKGITSAPLIATLSNNTGKSITDLSIVASGEYAETDNCGTALANAASCTLQITVTPATKGAITGTVAISGGGVVANLLPLGGNALGANGAASTSGIGVVATLADTDGASTVNQLAFGIAPPPTIAAGGNAGAAISVRENSNTGSIVAGTDIITLTVAGPGGYGRTYTAKASEGVAVFNLSGDVLTLAGNYTYTVTVASKASIKAASANETVNVGAAAAVSTTAGDGQSAIVDKPFAAALEVTVKDAFGNAVSGATVTFADPPTGASAKLSIATVVTGIAGTASITATANGIPGIYEITASVAGATQATFSLTNSGATPTVTLATGSNRTLFEIRATFTATVSASFGTPTGTVKFNDGSTQLGSGTIVSGTVAFTTSSLAAGVHSIIAVYSGDSIYSSASSAAVTQTVVDYAVSPSGETAQTVTPGGSATYVVAVTPTEGANLPAAATLTVTGLPTGATASLAAASTAATWTQQTATSWQVPAGTTLGNVSLTFNIPGLAMTSPKPKLPGRTASPLLWALLLLPFATKFWRAGKRMHRPLLLLLCLAVSGVAVAGFSGCSARNGFFGQPATTYDITVTVTAGSLSHSTNLTLKVE